MRRHLVPLLVPILRGRHTDRIRVESLSGHSQSNSPDLPGNKLLLAGLALLVVGQLGTTHLASAASLGGVAANDITSLVVVQAVDLPAGDDCVNCTVAVEITQDNPAAYCAVATIVGTEGTSGDPVPYQATIDMTDYPLEGTLTGAGNLHTAVDFTHTDGILTFWGNASKSSWHSNVWVGKSFTINWCADRDIPTEGNIWTDIEFASDWGAGYCVDFEVHTDEPGGVEWTIELDLAEPPFNGGPSPNSHWNFAYSMDGTVMTAWGTGGVWETQYTFDDAPADSMGFCASR